MEKQNKIHVGCVVLHNDESRAVVLDEVVDGNDTNFFVFTENACVESWNISSMVVVKDSDFVSKLLKKIRHFKF